VHYDAHFTELKALQGALDSFPGHSMCIFFIAKFGHRSRL